MRLLDFLFNKTTDFCEHDLKKVHSICFTKEVLDKYYDIIKQDYKVVLYECKKCGKKQWLSNRDLYKYCSDLKSILISWENGSITTEQVKDLYP